MAGSGSRARAAFRRRGLAGVLKIAWRRGRRRIYLREEHIWYQMSTAAARLLELPAGIELTRATSTHELEIASQTGKDVEIARRHLAEGHELWLAHAEDVAAFTCWVFHGRTPALAAPGGWLELPQRTVCVEDVITSPEYRGRGIAPGAFSAIACSLGPTGVQTLIAKIETPNAPSQRAFEKAGFSPTARSEFELIGPFRRSAVGDARGEIGAHLTVALEERTRRPSDRVKLRAARIKAVAIQEDPETDVDRRGA